MKYKVNTGLKKLRIKESKRRTCISILSSNTKHDSKMENSNNSVENTRELKLRILLEFKDKEDRTRIKNFLFCLEGEVYE